MSRLLDNMRKLWPKSKTKFGNYNIVQPCQVSPLKHVPSHIKTPPYYTSGEPIKHITAPEIKNDVQIAMMKNSCCLAAEILRKIGDYIQVGRTTDDLDSFAHNLIISNGAYPSPLHYNRFPKSICTSVNNVACHGIPDDRPLQNGDIINVDVTVYLNGYHGDCSKTFLVGDVDDEGKNLVTATEICLNEAISMCRPGQPFKKIGTTIETKARQLGYWVVPCFIGHGIGDYFHGPPDIYHFRNEHPGTMQRGMTFTIEPVLAQGSIDVEVLEDEWTAVMVDEGRAAQFEHTVLITENGVDVLTR